MILVNITILPTKKKKIAISISTAMIFFFFLILDLLIDPLSDNNSLIGPFFLRVQIIFLLEVAT